VKALGSGKQLKEVFWQVQESIDGNAFLEDLAP